MNESIQMRPAPPIYALSFSLLSTAAPRSTRLACQLSELSETTIQCIYDRHRINESVAQALNMEMSL